MFSPDGKRILSCSADKTAKVYNASGGKMISDLKGYTSGLWSVMPSPDGEKILAVSGDNTAKIWSIKSGKIIYELKGHSDSVYAAVFDPSGKKIATISRDKTAKLWDAENGNLLAELKKHSNRVTAVQFSPDSKFLATGSEDKSLIIWNAGNGVFLNQCTGHTNGVVSLQFSADSKMIISASKDSTARVWDAATGKFITGLVGNRGRLLSVAFSPDGSKALTTSMDSIVKLYSLPAGKLLADLKGHSGPVSSGKFSPDGKYILTAGYDPVVKLWSADDGKWIKDFAGHSYNLRSADFTSDGKKIITASRDNSSKVFDLATGKILDDFSKQPGEVESGILTKNESLAVTSSARTAVSIYDPATAKLLYTFFTVGGSDFLVVDKDGHYDGTEAARKLIYFTCGTEVIALDQVKDRLWVPNLAERVMAREAINGAKLSDLNICAYTPAVERLNTDEGYHFKITPRRGGLGETVLYINNIEVRRYKPVQLQKTGNDYDLFVKAGELKNFLIPGSENLVMVKSYVAANDISSRGVEVTKEADERETAPPNLHAVIIGVSDYKGDELDLKYAAKDASDISKALSLSAAKLLGKDHVFMYDLTTDKERYKLPEKKSIKDVFEEIGRKATANDVLMIFFAGHGMVEAETKQFYFLTSDASPALTNSTGLKDVGIGVEELMEWMKPANIKAQKRILILDACHSGSAINQMVDIGKGQYLASRGDEKTQQIKQLDKLNEKSGLYILAASASNQVAYEMGKYSQGLLTYALLKVIKEHPELLEQNKYLNVSNWFNETVKTVSDLVRESNLRQEPQLVTTTNFNIGVVDGEVLAKIVLPDEKPVFTSSNFQNSDENIADDDLELSKVINQHLNEVSSRGTDGNIIFLTGSNAPNAWTLTGRYTLNGDDLTVKVNVKQNKVSKKNMELSGKKSNLSALAAEIVGAASEWIMNTK